MANPNPNPRLLTDQEIAEVVGSMAFKIRGEWLREYLTDICVCQDAKTHAANLADCRAEVIAELRKKAEAGKWDKAYIEYFFGGAK